MSPRTFKVIVAKLSAFVALATAAVPAGADTTIVLNFAGLNGASREGVANYYDGGLGSLGSGPGPNYGITFGSDAITCATAPACNTAEIPGGAGANAVFFVTGTGDIMNRAAGFTTGFSFFYTAANQPGTVSVYSGLNGTGSLLASLSLPVTGNGATTPGCMGTNFCPYTAFGVTFKGTAESVDFSGTENQIGFADITLGSATAGGGKGVPEPATLSLVVAGLIGLCFMRRRRPGPMARTTS